MLQMTPWSASSFWNCLLLYWLRVSDAAAVGGLVDRLSRLRRQLLSSVSWVGSGPDSRQQRVHLMRLGPAGDDPLEHVGQLSQWIDAIQLGRLDQRHCQCPVFRPASALNPLFT